MNRFEDRPPPDASHERERIFEQAAIWFATMQGSTPSHAERDALAVWLAADPRHAEAYANIERLWAGAVDLPGLKERHEAVQQALTRRRFGKAVIVAAAGAGAWSYLAGHPFADYRTATGERRTVALPDGSWVELAADTALSLGFSQDARHLTLHGGEAFFMVAADAARPFVVEAGTGLTTALGTAFGVAYLDDAAEITVTEHAVKVALGTQSAQVAAGSAVSYDGRAIGAVHDSNGGETLAWREGRLVFTQASLATVVGALNRWRRGRILVMDGGLAARTITLIVNLDRSDTIVAQLAEALPIRVIKLSSYLTLLFPA